MTSSAKTTAVPSTRSTDTTTSAVEFAKLLRDRRETAGLSRRGLAEASGLSEATIKFIELGKTRPSRRTLLQLLMVPGLRLLSHDLPMPRRELPKGLFSPQSTPANCYLAPDYEPIRCLEELERTLRGAGGQIEQSNLYLTPQSAAGYLRFVRSSQREQKRRTQLPFSEIVDGIPGSLTTRGLTVIALGSGDGQPEVRLLQKLIALQKTAVSLWLVDRSEALLATAFAHAGEMLGPALVHRLGVLGDFHHLPRYTDLISPLLERDEQRMYVLLGTLGHLDHEPRFLRDMLAKVTRPDDLLLLDADLLLPGESDLQPLIGKVPVDDTALSDWLFEPFLHAKPRPHHIVLEQRLDVSDSIPDCQTTSIIATVETRGMLPRQFSVLRQRRYRLSSLRTVLAQSGFVTLGTELWQDPQHGTTALLLCQRSDGS